MGADERRLEIIRILCQRRHEKMSNLAFEFGVSLRTIQRDINEISTSIPIYIKTGRYEGGVYLIDGYYSDCLYMKKSEIELLKKVRKSLLQDDKCLLNHYELQSFCKLIQDYSPPSVKNNF